MQSQPGKHSSVFDALDSFISTRIAPVEEDKAGGNESDEEILMLDSAGPADSSRVGGKPCFNFSQTGQCRFGSVCRYSHALPKCVTDPSAYKKYECRDAPPISGASQRAALMDALQAAQKSKASQSGSADPDWVVPEPGQIVFSARAASNRKPRIATEEIAGTGLRPHARENEATRHHPAHVAHAPVPSIAGSSQDAAADSDGGRAGDEVTGPTSTAFKSKRRPRGLSDKRKRPASP